MCVVLNRVGGITGVLIRSYADVETIAPLFVCASLLGLLELGFAALNTKKETET
jgi:hypothetical protein